MAGSLFRRRARGNEQAFCTNLNRRKLTPSDSLAKLLRASDKKSSTESKLTAKKKTSRVKHSHHKLRTSKSLASHKTHASKKSAYNTSKRKSLKKASHHKTNLPARKLVSDKRRTD